MKNPQRDITRKLVLGLSDRIHTLSGSDLTLTKNGNVSITLKASANVEVLYRHHRSGVLLLEHDYKNDLNATSKIATHAAFFSYRHQISCTQKNHQNIFDVCR